VDNLRCHVIVFSLMVLLSSREPSIASDTVWTNPSLGSWFDANNWSAGVPILGHGDGALINQGVSSIDGASAASHFLQVGTSLSGALRIQNGGQLTTSFGYLNSIGMGANAVGSVTIAGVGSRWETESKLVLGGRGSGQLVIEDGGVAFFGGAIVGQQAGSQGALLVTGAGSSWLGNASVGVEGNGGITIANGAVAGGALGLGQTDGSVGTVTIMGKGSRWGLSDTLITTATIGVLGRGELSVMEGGAIFNGMVDIASFEGSTAKIVVDGLGSQWNVTERFRIGVGGTAEITVSDGGVVKSDEQMAFAINAGSFAALTVYGAGSTWDSNHRLILGDLADFSEAGGKAVVTITDGGRVKSRGALIGRGLQSNGEVTVRGVGSVFETGGFLSDFVVGDTGAGFVIVEEGGTLTSTLGFVGNSSKGIAIISGAGSTWNNQLEITIGVSNQGELTISDGAKVVSGVTDQSAASIIGDAHSATGAVAVEGEGSTWTNGTALRVGFEGDGLLTITAGGAVSNILGVIGMNPQSSGVAKVVGPGSTWTNSSDLVVGDSGTASLFISDGAAVSNMVGVMGMDSGSSGAGKVTGIGSTWTNSSNLTVGDHGTATLTIADGGVVSNTLGTVGGQAGSSGLVTVSGHDSTWINSANLLLGHRGAGEVVVSDGGHLSSQIGIIGFLPGSLGIATVVGEGSMWSASSLFVGGASSGSLSIGTGGAVTTQQIFVSSLGSVVVADGGTLDASQVTTIGSVTNQGILLGDLNVAGGGAAIGSGVFAGAVTIADGGMFSPGASPGPAFTTDTTWSAGGSYRWEINALEWAGGTEGGNPGWDFWNAGELSISGPFTIELASLGLNDTLAGLEDWNPNHAYQWRIAEATNPAFTSLEALIVSDEDFVNPLAGGSFWLSASDEGRALYLNFTPIPEPSTLALCVSAIGAFAVCWCNRRKRHS
jgi:T5SS/PEP-CTERM-associated repeat protein